MGLVNRLMAFKIKKFLFNSDYMVVNSDKKRVIFKIDLLPLRLSLFPSIIVEKKYLTLEIILKKVTSIDDLKKYQRKCLEFNERINFFKSYINENKLLIVKDDWYSNFYNYQEDIIMLIDYLIEKNQIIGELL